MRTCSLFNRISQHALHQGGVPGSRGVPGRGVYLVPGGCTWSGWGVYLVTGGCTWFGGCTWSGWGVYLVWLGGVPGPRGGCTGPGGCTWSRGVCSNPGDPVNRMTDACQFYITLPQLRCGR